MTGVATTNGSELAIRAEQRGFTEGQVQALKKMNGWEHVPDAELAVFFHQAQRTGLDPFARQIYLIPRYSRKNNRTEYTIQTGIDGLRLIADRTGRYAGSEAPVFDEDDYGLYARVTVYKIVEGARCPFTAVAYLREYKDERSPMWSRMERGQLGKCSKALALRKAFPADLSGIYAHEEMDQAWPEVNGEHRDGAIEGEVVEETPRRSDEHAALLEQVANAWLALPENERPNKRQVWDFATRSKQSAAKCLDRLRKLAEHDQASGETGEDWSPLLEALADQLYGDRAEHLSGSEWKQREIGKPFSELGADGAQELYESMKREEEEGT